MGKVALKTKAAVEMGLCLNLCVMTNPVCTERERFQLVIVMSTNLVPPAPRSVLRHVRVDCVLTLELLSANNRLLLAGVIWKRRVREERETGRWCRLQTCWRGTFPGSCHGG